MCLHSHEKSATIHVRNRTPQCHAYRSVASHSVRAELSLLEVWGGLVMHHWHSWIMKGQAQNLANFTQQCFSGLEGKIPYCAKRSQLQANLVGSLKELSHFWLLIHWEIVGPGTRQKERCKGLGTCFRISNFNLRSKELSKLPVAGIRIIEK